MQTASVTTVKKELKHLPKEDLESLCLKLTKFKKENKEYISYLLFESEFESEFIESVKNEVSILFQEINPDSYFYMKKTIRKILRLIKKYIRFSKIKSTEVELLIHFCKEMNQVRPTIKRNAVLTNMYDRQVEIIGKTIDKLHDDLQFDYREDLEMLMGA